jgi:N-acyl-D-amino-acid deacylase
MRNEAEAAASIEETFAIGEAVDTPVLISHHKLMREPNFGQSTATLARIAEQMQCQCVALDCYPYNASSTMLHLDEARLQGKVVIASERQPPGDARQGAGGYCRAVGVSRAEASARLQPASAIYFSMDEADVQRILAFEPTMIGSDGIPTGEQPHPRLWGTFPACWATTAATWACFRWRLRCGK